MREVHHHQISISRDGLRSLLLHVSIICSLVILFAGILDWYNPYMNFSGQIRPIEILQLGALVFLALTKKPERQIRQHGTRQIRRHP